MVRVVPHSTKKTTAATTAKSTKSSGASASSGGAGAVQVYLRLRPLITEEEGHELMEYKIDRSSSTANNNNSNEITGSSPPPTTRARIQLKLQPPAPATTTESTTPTSSSPVTMNPNFANAPPLRRRQNGTIKNFNGYTNIFEEDVTNSGVYQSTVQPLISEIATCASSSACVFTYGHTGSGKSHTLLGYEDKPNASGIYKYAAADLFQLLQLQQQHEQSPEDQKCLLVRVTELYKDQVRDLVSGNICSIRKDATGIVRVRGPMIEDATTEKIEQQPLGKLCFSTSEVVECVEDACAARRVGTSTHHDQSSRSHLIVEMEIVTPALVQARNLYTQQDSQLNRLRWLQTERMYKGNNDRPLPKWTLEYTNSAKKLRNDIQLYEKLTKETQQQLKNLTKAYNLGGTLVFCDLAGNEYARDATGSTKEELEEAAEINKSLLAVKETIRSLRTIQMKQKQQQQQNNHKKHGKNNNHHHQHVPYRDSKLTMILARHLQTRAVMLAHISPSLQSIKKTINTLNYSSMVNSSSNTTTTTKKASANTNNTKSTKSTTINRSS